MLKYNEGFIRQEINRVRSDAFVQAARYTLANEFENAGTNRRVEIIGETKWPYCFCDRKGNTVLHTAVVENEIRYVEAILMSKSVKIDFQNETGDSALMLAAAYGRRDIVEMLLKAGANVFVTNASNETVLILAAKNKKITIIDLFLDHMQTLIHKNEAKKKKYSIFACFTAQEDELPFGIIGTLIVQCDSSVKSFLNYLFDEAEYFKKVAYVPIVFRSFIYHPSPLLNGLLENVNRGHYELALDRSKYTDEMLQNFSKYPKLSFNPNDPIDVLVSQHVWCSFVNAVIADCYSKRFPLYLDDPMRFLISALQNDHMDIFFTSFWTFKKVDNEVFYYAAENGHARVFQEIDLIDEELIKSCIIRALIFKQSHVHQILLEKYADVLEIDLRAYGNFECNDENLIKAIVNMGINQDDLDLIFKVKLSEGKYHEIEDIVSKAYIFDSKPVVLDRLLVLVCFKDKGSLSFQDSVDLARLCRMTVEAGADVYTITPNGQPLLHQMIKKSDHFIAQILISAPEFISLEVTDSEGNTPLQLACQENNYELVKLLLERGAKASKVEASFLENHCTLSIQNLFK